MRTLWTVMKFELRLLWSSWVTWLIALIVLFLGARCAADNRHEPWQSWVQIHSAAFFVTLILAFCTGNQINRDREQRLAGTVLSTPLPTPTYVLGKYLAALASLLLLAGSGLLSALLMDRFYTAHHGFLIFAPALYPPLGMHPYLIGWLWFQLPVIVFGAAFMLACITLTGGQRLIAALAVLLLWVVPVILSSAIPHLIDVTATVFYPQFSLASPNHVPDTNPLSQFLHQHPSWHLGAPHPEHLVRQFMRISLADIPRSTLPPATLLWNRLFFLSLSLGLFIATVAGTHVLRRRAW